MAHPKAVVINAIMKNPKLSKELRDAFNSPPGSTQRKKMAKAIKAMSLTSSNRWGYSFNDGQGGYRPYTYTAQPPSLPKAKEKEVREKEPPKYKNTQILPNLVSFKRGKGGKGGYDGKGGPATNYGALTIGGAPSSSSAGSQYGSFDPKTGSFIPAGAAPVTTPSPTIASSPFLNVRGTGEYVPPSSSYNTGNVVMFSPGSTAGLAAPTAAPATGTSAISRLASKTTPPATSTGRGKIAVGTYSIPNLMTGIQFNSDLAAAQSSLRSSNGDNWGAVWNDFKAKYPEKSNAEIDNLLERNRYYKPNTWEKVGVKPATGTKTAEVIKEAATPTVGQETMQNVIAQEQGTPAAGYTATSDTATSSEIPMGVPTGAAPSGDLETTAYEFGQRGVGPVTYSMQMIYGNKKALADYLNTSPEYLPDTNLLYANVNDVIEAHKKEYQINELQDQLTKRINAGYTLGDDLRNYIAGRDEAVNAIDAMMEKTKEYMKGMDMADPTNQKDMQNYMNYLITLKGRNTQRYTDFYNTSKNAYDAQTQQLKDLYDSNWQKVQDEIEAFKNDKSQAEAFYSKIDAMLQDLYTNVNNRDQIALERATMAVDYQKKVGDLAKQAAEMAGTSESVLKDTPFVVNAAENPEFYLARNNKQITYTDAAGKTQTLTVWNSPILDLYNQVNNNLVTENRTADPRAVIQAYAANMANAGRIVATASPGDNGQFQETISNYLARLKEFQDQAGVQMQTDPTTGEEVDATQENLKIMLGALYNSVIPALKGKLQGDPDQVANVSKAIMDLASAKDTLFSKGTTWGQIADDQVLDNWKKKYSSTVNSAVLDAIANYVKNNQAETNSNVPAKQFFVDVVNTNPAYQEGTGTPAWKKTSIGAFSADDLMTIISDGLFTI